MAGGRPITARSRCSRVCCLDDQAILQRTAGTPTLAQRRPSPRTARHSGEEPAEPEGPRLHPPAASAIQHAPRMLGSDVLAPPLQSSGEVIHSFIHSTNPPLNYDQPGVNAVSFVSKGSRALSRAACRPGLPVQLPRGTRTLHICRMTQQLTRRERSVLQGLVLTDTCR